MALLGGLRPVEERFPGFIPPGKGLAGNLMGTTPTRAFCTLEQTPCMRSSLVCLRISAINLHHRLAGHPSLHTLVQSLRTRNVAREIISISLL